MDVFPDDHPFLGGLPPGECLSNDQRQIDFQFVGPVMFRLVSFSGAPEHRDYFRSVKFKLSDIAFEADFDHIQNTEYPFMFGRHSSTMDFERAFGIYEFRDKRDTEGGIIDEAGPNRELAQAFPRQLNRLTRLQSLLDFSAVQRELRNPNVLVFGGEETSLFYKKDF